MIPIAVGNIMRENIIKRVASIPIVGYILKSISVSRNEDDKNKKPSTKSSNLNCARAACNDISSNFHASMMAIAKADVNNLDPRDSVPTRGPIVSYTIDYYCSFLFLCTSISQDRVELGRSTWNLLHTTCANYPSNPSAEEQSQAEKMIMSLARLYPCPHCAKDFRAAVKLNPPRFTIILVILKTYCHMR